MSVAFLYICTNPFIYATNFDPVRRTLIKLISCRKSFSEADLQSSDLVIGSTTV